ncbi:hypothetical protein NMG60_11026564 [Bertholletia excelsa]
MPSLSSSSDSHRYLVDNFCANGWENPKTHQIKQVVEETAADLSMLNILIGSEFQQHTAPEFEDFLGSESTHEDSSLTHFYEPSGSSAAATAAAYFNGDHQHFKTIPETATFPSSISTSSASEVDDSGSGSNQLPFGDLVGQSTGALSLAIKTHSSVGSETNCKKKVDRFGQRTSIYRGVTRHRWTGRYEAHLWDNSCRRDGQARKGRQGGYDEEEKAARAYDLAALKYWGPAATTNFPVSNYTKELEEMKHVSKQELIASVRRKSSGFSRGASAYRGVTKHHQQGRWQARIGRVAGNKDLYLGTFATEEEAAEAYDIAAIKFRGLNAVTNFEMSRYNVETIRKSALPIGGAAKRLRLSLEGEQKPFLNHDQKQLQSCCHSSNFDFSTVDPLRAIPTGVPYFDVSACYHQNLFNLYSDNETSNSEAPDSTSSMLTPATILPSPAEFLIWPHSSY